MTIFVILYLLSIIGTFLCMYFMLKDESNYRNKWTNGNKILSGLVSLIPFVNFIFTIVVGMLLVAYTINSIIEYVDNLPDDDSTRARFIRWWNKK